MIVPYLRGYGPTRFNSPDTLRSGQQAALAQDLLELMDALGIEQATLCGYDWGGRAVWIGDGYNLQDIPNSTRPLDPESEHRYWYQYYFHTPRGVEGLDAESSDAVRVAVAVVVANLGEKRRALSAERTGVRQPGFRRRGDSLLSPSFYVCAG